MKRIKAYPRINIRYNSESEHGRIYLSARPLKRLPFYVQIIKLPAYAFRQSTECYKRPRQYAGIHPPGQVQNHDKAFPVGESLAANV